MRWQWIAAPVLIAFVALCAWTAYANVFSDETLLRGRAETLARDKAGCGDKCKLVRADGQRGVFSTTIKYTFTRTGLITVTCRRPYVAFGAFACSATKQE